MSRTTLPVCPKTRLNLPQPHSPSLPTHCTAPGNRECALSDCFLAVGQAVGPDKAVDFDTVTWWHRRYRQAFHHAMTTRGTSWAADRRRVTAVGRYLGQRVVEHAGRRATIDRAAAARASAEVELGCEMNATRDVFSPADCTNPAVTAFSS